MYLMTEFAEEGKDEEEEERKKIKFNTLKLASNNKNHES